MTFNRGEKRALFIEIPSGGGDDQFIPLSALTDGNVLQWTISPHQDINGAWTDNGILYPDTYADLAYAQWQWNPDEATYPTSTTYGKQTPIFTDGRDKNKDYNMVHGPWKGHSLAFTVPIASLPAGKTIVLSARMQGARYVPKGWAVDISLDNGDLEYMTVTGADDSYINQTVIEKNSPDGEAFNLVAPFIFKKENADPQIEARYTATRDLSNVCVVIRIRAITYLYANSQVDSDPKYNFEPKFHSTYTRLYFLPLNSTHPGPYLYVE